MFITMIFAYRNVTAFLHIQKSFHYTNFTLEDYIGTQNYLTKTEGLWNFCFLHICVLVHGSHLKNQWNDNCTLNQYLTKRCLKKVGCVFRKQGNKTYLFPFICCSNRLKQVFWSEFILTNLQYNFFAYLQNNYNLIYKNGHHAFQVTVWGYPS